MEQLADEGRICSVETLSSGTEKISIVEIDLGGGPEYWILATSTQAIDIDRANRTVRGAKLIVRDGKPERSSSFFERRGFGVERIRIRF
jgi:hypothetical protein